MKKKLLIAAASAAVLLAAVILAASNYLVNFAIVRSDTPHDVAPDSIVEEGAASQIAANREAIGLVRDQWLASAVVEEQTILSHDGLTLAANLYPNEADSHKWLLGVHGYTSRKEHYHDIASVYAARGYHVLLPDMRAHGDSEGTYIGMGWLDRLDVLRWIDRIIELDPQAEIILHGTSMGGATVMMTAGEPLPSNVKGIVEDCGYTSVWDIFADELAYLFHLPPFPLLYTASMVADVRAGYNFTEASAVEQVAKATVPMLFIHGSEDNFVFTDMVYTLHEACPTQKGLLVVEGAGHGEAYAMDPELYFNTVFDFINTHCIAD